VTCTVGAYVLALLGVPLRASEVVVLDTFMVIPVGSAPETMLHLYGVHPPMAFTAAE
jgi:hypothetical protein